MTFALPLGYHVATGGWPVPNWSDLTVRAWIDADEVVAVIVGRDCVERHIGAREAEAINTGAIASPNLFLSLAPEAQRILVRVFEKPVARGSPGDP